MHYIAAEISCVHVGTSKAFPYEKELRAEISNARIKRYSLQALWDVAKKGAVDSGSLLPHARQNSFLEQK